MKTFLKACLVLLVPLSTFAQVDQIKSASSHHSSGGGSSRNDGSGGSAFMGNFIFNMIFSEVIPAQKRKLQQKADIPNIVSLDVIAQTAVQPSNYYVINPRIRANWGLFSTDIRMNYLLEEGIDGIKYFRTTDWQIVELNLVTTKDVVFRVGGGTLVENFEAKNSYPEWTAAFQYHPRGAKWGGVSEYRGSEVRKEGSAFAQYKIFERGYLHTYLTAGAVYQRYYQSITTWGLQGGLICKVY
jgi:hypothetical protein